ncbi:hypothetical protein, partial [Lewinella sp. W8]|uniref:hypothetical protein n=1 Tax=Lewinella sp. W8 TaxID=2528208 RepID=UPI0012B54905
MKQARQLLMLAFCCLFSVALAAQDPVYEVNLGNISDINLTLNDDCQALLIPEMVLTGDRDVDGDGIVAPWELFCITVMDSNPANGPIIDGCGEYSYKIEAKEEVEVTPPVAGFLANDGVAYDLNLFTISDDNFGFFDFIVTDDLVGVATDGNFFAGGDDYALFAQFDFFETGTFSFDYSFTRTNELEDDLGFLLFDFEGFPIEDVVEFFDENITGSASFDVQPGSVLRAGIIDDGDFDFQFEVFELTNGVFDPMDIIFPVEGYTTSWGRVNAEDKTPPAVVSTPDDEVLPCTDFEEIMLTMLDINISRCWEVARGTDGVFRTVPGTMATALRDRLDLIAFDPGAGTAVVPEFTDGCAPRLQVCVNDVATFGEDPACDDITITRTFTATEISDCESAAGEENGPAVTSFDIDFVRPELGDIEPAGDQLDVAEYECDETLTLDANGNPVPRAGDLPFWTFEDRTIPLVLDGSVCNIALTYEDGPRIQTCPNTYKFVRTYTVIDWCAPQTVRTYTQVVKVGDTTAPDFTAPTQDRDFDGIIDDGPLEFSTNAGDICAAYIRLDDPSIRLTDNCSAGIELKADIYPFQNLNGAPIGTFFLDLNDGDAEIAGPIPAGTHTLRYTYTDDCGNSDFTDVPFTVIDRTAPVAICEDGLNISLTSGSSTGGPSTGVAVLTPEMIDNGSYDDCGDVTLHIGRVRQLANGTYELLPGAVYTDQLLLTCEDLGNVLVGLRVTDERGNVNYCWLEVLVEDKARPICFAPAPINISCIAYNAELPADISEATDEELDAAFGAATGIDNCEVTITQTISGDVNSCGVGQFTRVFTATDGQGLTNAAACTQRITVYGIHDYTLTFPTDEEADCAVVPDYDGIGIDERACDLITINPSVDTFRTTGTASEECFKLEVTYDIINW